MALVCCLALAVTPIALGRLADGGSVAAASANTNWGLSFQESGKTPIGNASADFLKQYNSYFVGNTSEKKIYLTFDAGYENGYTPAILDVLKKHNAKAAFFVVGNYIETAPDLIKRMAAEGHIVGNHTYHHPDMSKISDFNAFKKEIEALEALFQQTTGQTMEKFYRPPQGKYSESNLAQAKQLGYETVFWKALPMWIGMWINSRPRSRRSKNYCPAFTPERLCCCTVRQKPTPIFWMNC